MFKKFFQKYDESNNLLKTLEVSKLNKIKSFVFGYLFSLIIVLAPIIILAHSFIYSFYLELIVLLLGVMVIIFASLGEIFYHKLLLHYANVENKSMKELHILDSILYTLICLICCIVIIILF